MSKKGQELDSSFTVKFEMDRELIEKQLIHMKLTDEQWEDIRDDSENMDWLDSHRMTLQFNGYIDNLDNLI